LKRLKAKQARRGKRDEDEGEENQAELASYSGDNSQADNDEFQN